jgi:hypothetical protein
MYFCSMGKAGDNDATSASLTPRIRAYTCKEEFGGSYVLLVLECRGAFHCLPNMPKLPHTMLR